MNRNLLCRAIKASAKNTYDVFHLSCHGSKRGVLLTDGTRLSWSELADCFQQGDRAPKALILSSCVGGDGGIARAFEQRKRRPHVIFGAEADDEDNLLTFPSACIAWPILYTVLASHGMTPSAFKDAVKKMNSVTPHRFAYRRLEGGKYRRFPTK